MGIQYKREIDGLRAVAVLAVVAYHAGLGGAGFVGVDVFFVISGYLITGILASQERIDFLQFYARRARRILPALAVVVAVTLALSTFVLSDTSDVWKSALAAAGFVANIFFQSEDYWTSDTRPLLHLWSLSVEEQFYLVWPVLMLLARRRGMVLSCITVLSFVLAETLDSRIAFYTMPARAWELAIGALLALYPLKVPRITSAVGLALTLFACVLPMPSFPGVGAIPAVLGAAMVIAGGQNRILESRPMVAVGLISYSLYLWHWPLIVLGREVGLPALWAAALAFPLAYLTYRFVETPFRRMGGLNRKTAAFGVGCAAVIACTAWAIPAHRGDWSPLRETCFQDLGGSPDIAPACKPGAKVAILGDSMALAWYPFVDELYGDVALYSRGACSPQIGSGGPRDPRCPQFIANAIREARKADVVFVASTWSTLDRGRLDATLSALQGRRIYIIGPSPTLTENAPGCARFDRDCAVPLPSPELTNTLRKLAAKHGATVIDPMPFLCDRTCGAEREGVTLYWDMHHVSATAARAFAHSAESNFRD